MRRPYADSYFKVRRKSITKRRNLANITHPSSYVSES
jgi:hypothetical protein